MTQIKIDSVNSVQLARLKNFFEQAQNGDEVIIDRKLAEENAPSHEGLDDKGCNSWVYHFANQALAGFSDDKILKLLDDVTLTTAYLHAQYPQDYRPPASMQPVLVPEESFEEEWELDLIEPEVKEEDWGAVIRQYHEREPA